MDSGVGGPAELEVCGMTVRLSAGSQAVFTCSSLIAAPVSGSVDVVLDGGDVFVTVPAGSSVEIEDTAAGVSLSNVSGGGVTVTLDGTTVNVLNGPGPYDYAPDTTPPALQWNNWHNSWFVGLRSPTDYYPARVEVECADKSAVTATFVVRSSTNAVVHEATPAVIPAGGCEARLPDFLENSPIQFTWGGTLPDSSRAPNGSYPFVVEVRDSAGNSAQRTGTISVGSTIPVTLTSPGPGDVLTPGVVDVRFTVTADPGWEGMVARIDGCAWGQIADWPFSGPEVIQLDVSRCAPGPQDLVLASDGPIVSYRAWQQSIPIEIAAPDTDGPDVTVRFPDPPASGWYTGPDQLRRPSAG